MSRLIKLVDKNNITTEIEKAFSFGRQTPPYSDGTAVMSNRISRTHFHIEPLHKQDTRSHNNQYCAQLTLKGRYLRLTSNSLTKKYTKPGTKLSLCHNDILNLVDSAHSNEQFTLTVIDPTVPQTQTQTQTRKRKRSNDSFDLSPLSPPNRKRGKHASDSIAFDYNTNNLNTSNVSVPNYNARSPSPKRRISDHSLSGLITSHLDRTPSRHSTASNLSESGSNSKYAQLNSFPNSNSNNVSNISDNSAGFNQNLSLGMDSDNSDSDPFDQLLDSDKDTNALREEKELELKQEKIRVENELKMKENMANMLFNEGRYTIALPIIDCDKYKFESERVCQIIANELKRFMAIHRHPKLKVIVIATNAYKKVFTNALMSAYKNENRRDMSLELECEEEMPYQIFESEERIIIYSGQWCDILQLKDNGLCAQYIMNFSFWNFHARKGDRLNRLMHSKCQNLSDLSIQKYKTAKKMCKCYSVEINARNGGQLYNAQNIRNVLHIRAPNRNDKLTDYNSNEQSAYKQLKETYLRVLEQFYRLTALKMPLNDAFIVKDVRNWNNKALIKKENFCLTQQYKTAMSLSMSANSNSFEQSSHNSAMIEAGKSEDSLHFSLKRVPEYKMVSAHEWPKFNGHWSKALTVYLEDKSVRDTKWDKCIFYEDSEYVIIYDRYFKAKIHLLIMPKCQIKSVYDLDCENEKHLSIIEGMIARAKWIKIGILKRDKTLHNIKYGFHAIPSMNQLHCHLISDDMSSDNMKNKKHFHSFTSEYFVPAKVLLNVLKNEKREFRVNQTYYKGLLKRKLKCHFCGNEIKTIPALKKHIKQCQFGHSQQKSKGKKGNKINFKNSFGNDVSGGYVSDEENEAYRIVFAEDNP